MRSNGVELHTRPGRHWNSSTVWHKQVSFVNSQSNVPRENGQKYIAVVSKVCGVTLVVEYPQLIIFPIICDTGKTSQLGSTTSLLDLFIHNIMT